ncbi:DUF3907 family protein [Bacillus sp. Marseille-P3661]|uniref:DUF3907 family protein n=1 Tax=Bacillus sp. Marseille-P3661 TaxID=1936234 RepID=UPI000C81CB6D|nr:DUF3907 family protein [Bacillus sp. Marseille-P3661]
MSNSLVQSQSRKVQDFLEEAVSKIGGFLNNTTLDTLKTEKPEGTEEYYTALLSSLRRLCVFCEEGLDGSKVILNSETFRNGAAEKMLYWVHHHCIQEFYSPRLDKWYEDSRSAYTGKNSIKFREVVPESIQDLIRSLEKSFQEIREELEYYETDYKTKIVQSK